jgi:two-component system response regulator NreC
MRHLDKEILRLLAEGYTTKSIAFMTNATIKTVETYKYKLMKKLNAKNAPHLVAIAFKNKML